MVGMITQCSALGSTRLSPERRALAGIGPFSEVAFFHKPSRTLLLTDALIYVPQRPPEARPHLPGCA